VRGTLLPEKDDVGVTDARGMTMTFGGTFSPPPAVEEDGVSACSEDGDAMGEDTGEMVGVLNFTDLPPAVELLVTAESTFDCAEPSFPLDASTAFFGEFAFDAG
jgi:hypothetical protein